MLVVKAACAIEERRQDSWQIDEIIYSLLAETAYLTTAAA